MASRKGLSLICEIPNFANAYLGKFTHVSGLWLVLFWRSEQFCWPGGGKHPPPGMNRVKSSVLHENGCSPARFSKSQTKFYSGCSPHKNSARVGALF